MTADELDAWLVKQSDRLHEMMDPYLMAGGSLNDPQYRQQLGEHCAYMRVRSYLSGARKAASNYPEIPVSSPTDQDTLDTREVLAAWWDGEQATLHGLGSIERGAAALTTIKNRVRREAIAEGMKLARTGSVAAAPFRGYTVGGILPPQTRAE